MNYIQKYYDKHINYAGIYPDNISKVQCVDGFSMSVQASVYHYCSPKTNYFKGYDSWEIGFPTSIEETVMGYCDDIDNPLTTVYGYVPTDIVNSIIEKHGGIKE